MKNLILLHRDMSSKISSLIKQDKSLLEKMVNKARPKSKAYEDSYGYIIQATRNDGFKWRDPASKTLVFFGRKPNDEKILVVPNYFANSEFLVKVFSEVITIKGCNKVILKNIDPLDAEKFLRHGFRHYNSNESWDKSAKYDDQTFPQPIVNLSDAIKMMGNKYRNPRNNVGRNRSYQLRPYSSRDRLKVLEILKKKKGGIFDAHLMYLDANIEKFVVTFNDVVEGFLVVSKISSKTFAVNASIILSKNRGVGIWATYKIFIKKKKKGYKYANLGGSEKLGTHTFKEWNYKPNKYLYRTHLVFDKNDRLRFELK